MFKDIYKYIQGKCHDWQDRYGTKYIFIGLGALLGTNILMSSVVYYFAEDLDSLFDAFYWTITTISTVGYGDITPDSTVGKVVAMLNMLIGVALFPMFSAMVVGLLNNLWQKKTAVENAELKEQNTRIEAQNVRIEANQEEILELLRKQS